MATAHKARATVLRKMDDPSAHWDYFRAVLAAYQPTQFAESAHYASWGFSDGSVLRGHRVDGLAFDPARWPELWRAFSCI